MVEKSLKFATKIILVSRKMQFSAKSVGNKQAKLVKKLENRQISAKYARRPAAACGSEWNFLTGRRKCGDSGLRDGGAASRR